MPPFVIRQMTAVIAPRGGRIHVTGLSAPGITACRRKCDGWHVAPIAGSSDAAIRKAVDCEGCQDAMVRAVKAMTAAARAAAAKKARRR